MNGANGSNIRVARLFTLAGFIQRCRWAPSAAKIVEHLHESYEGATWREGMVSTAARRLFRDLECLMSLGLIENEDGIYHWRAGQ